MTVDTAWFKEQIAASPYGSLRGLCKVMRGKRGKPLEPSALSLALRGKRNITVDEAAQLARLLHVEISELMSRVAMPRRMHAR